MTRPRARAGLGAALAVICAAAACIAAAAPAAAGDTASGVAAGDVTEGGVPEAAPPSRRVYMITDSVGLGARSALTAAFPAGWQVTIDGDPGEFTETLERLYVAPRLASTPDVFGDAAIVAAGYNYPYWDPARFDRSVDSMVATLTRAGVRHVFWVTLRDVKPQYVSPAAWRQIQPYYWYFPEVNRHLEAALDRHPNLSLIDWAAVADQPGLTYDAIHLNTAGAALYSAIARQAIVDATTAVGAGSVTRVAVPGGPGVDAVALNLTTVDPRRPGYLTAFDCDQPVPGISNHNHARDQVVAHAAIAPVSATGDVCVYSSTDTNLVVDMTGRFDAAAGVAPATRRLVDTRDAGAPQPALEPLAVDVGGTGPVALELTAVGAAGPGWARVAPCDSTSTTSTVNVVDAAAVPNLAVVTPGADGRVCVTASVDTHLIVDLLVTFDPAAGIGGGPPRRVLDTRDGGARVAAGGTVVLGGDRLGSSASDGASAGGGSDAGAVILNVTATDALAPGFLTVRPCAAGPAPTSNLNVPAGGTVANLVVVEPDAGGDVCIDSLAPTHVVVDLLGTIAAGFTGGPPERLLDTRTANLPAGWP